MIVHNEFVFKISVPLHNARQREYEALLWSFLGDRRKTIISLNTLDIHTAASTVAPSGSDTPSGRPIYIDAEELGCGVFGRVFKAINVSTGDIYASKEFFRTGRRTEVEILKTVAHVRSMLTRYVSILISS